jgi:hypothetical protein
MGHMLFPRVVVDTTGNLHIYVGQVVLNASGHPFCLLSIRTPLTS